MAYGHEHWTPPSLSISNRDLPFAENSSRLNFHVENSDNALATVDLDVEAEALTLRQVDENGGVLESIRITKV